VRQKVAASAFARGYLDGIVTRVFDQLADAGYFYDPVEREVRGRGQRAGGTSGVSQGEGVVAGCCAAAVLWCGQSMGFPVGQWIMV
jgi:hypothetical protein